MGRALAASRHIEDHSPADELNVLLLFQNGHYVKEREYEGVGIVPYDPYHNSSFVVAGNIEEHVLFKDNMQRKLFMGAVFPQN